jgi:outer membrane protein assembly factor BamB
VLLAFFAGLSLPSVSLAQPRALHWPQFRGPGGMGVSKEAVPAKWGPQENLLWKTEMPGAGSSTPIIVGDKVYLTCFSGYSVPGKPKGELDQLQRHLVCVNRADGTIVWDKTFKAKQPESEKIRESHGYASNSLAADNDRLYAFFGRSGVFAFDHDGKQLWHEDVGNGIDYYGSAASPVLFEDLVLINASVESKALIALDKKTGKEKWRQGGMEQSWNTPVLVPVPGKGTELVMAIGAGGGSKSGKILGFDPATGKPLWSCRNDNYWYMVPSVVAHDGIVYALGGRDGIVGLSVRAGGSGDVTATQRLWTSKSGANVPSPIYHEGHLYWINDATNIAFCANAKTGAVVYEQRLNQANGFFASPVLAGGKLYYLDRGGKTFVLAAQPKYELLSVNNLKDGTMFYASPSASGGQLYLRSDRYLYCVGEKK